MRHRLAALARRLALPAAILLVAALAGLPPAAAQERRVSLQFTAELLNQIATDNQGEQTEEIVKRIVGISPGIVDVALLRASGRITLRVTPRTEDDMQPVFRFTLDKMLYYRLKTAKADVNGMTQALQEAKAGDPLITAVAYRFDDRYSIIDVTLDLRAAAKARDAERDKSAAREREEAAARAAEQAKADAAARAAAEARAGAEAKAAAAAREREEAAARASAQAKMETEGRAARAAAAAEARAAAAEAKAAAAAQAKAEAELKAAEDAAPGTHLSVRRIGRRAPPALDGAGADAAWADAPAYPVEVQGASGRFTVTLQGLWSAERLWLLVRWPDKEKSDAHRPWVWSNQDKAYAAGREVEDALALAFAREGRMGECMLAGIEATADLWSWRAGRTDPAGYAEDGLLTMSFERITRANSYQTRNGRSVWIKETADAGSPPYQSQVVGAFAGERMARYIPRTPSGSIADVTAKGAWKDGWWTVELSRRLATGDPEDVAFAPGRDGWLSVAVFNHREGTDHSTSKELLVKLEER